MPMKSRLSKIANNACTTEKKKLLKINDSVEDKQVPQIMKKIPKNASLSHHLKDTSDNEVLIEFIIYKFFFLHKNMKTRYTKLLIMLW